MEMTARDTEILRSPRLRLRLKLANKGKRILLLASVGRRN